MATNLNTIETNLLRQIDIHTGDNGGDFTFSDEISYRAAGIDSEQAYGGYLSQLIKKGCVSVDDFTTDAGSCFQMYLTDEGREILRAAGHIPYSY